MTQPVLARSGGKSWHVALAFCALNDASPVIIGQVIGNGGEGATYTLKNGQKILLSGQVCRALPPGYPKWDL